MEEVWKDIEGYENKYQVSNLGRIKSLYYKKSINHLPDTSKVLKRLNNNRITLSKDNIMKTFSVSRLVAKAFVSNPNNQPEVGHLDGDKNNNAASNLVWCDRRFNIKYGAGHLQRKKSLSKKVYQFSLDGEFIAEYPSGTLASKMNNIDQSCICACCRGRLKRAGQYKWSYNKQEPKYNYW